MLGIYRGKITFPDTKVMSEKISGATSIKHIAFLLTMVSC